MKSNQTATQERSLKVYYKAITFSISFEQSRTKFLPEIRLMGQWLANCGFEPGQYIKVSTRRNKLIITRIPDKL